MKFIPKLNLNLKKLQSYWKLSLLIVIIVVLVIAGWIYVDDSANYPSSEDAYVNAHITHVAAQINGQVASINVNNHEVVHKGQLLLTIESAQYENRLARAKANLLAMRSQVSENQDAIAEAKADLVKAQARARVVNRQSTRTLTLVRQHVASQQAGDEAIGHRQAVNAEVEAAEDALKAVRKTFDTDRAKVQVAQAELQQAALDLQWTKIKAPTSGVVSHFSLRPGDYVEPGNDLFAIVNTDQWWVNANYKETDLKRVRIGQPATVTLDMYPGIHFKGYVSAISIGSGTTFSLLPPQNATGNWVKVTQRFPVKITIPPQSLKQDYPLRVGATATVRIDTLATLHQSNQHQQPKPQH